jgi:type IV secretion system protein VirD4
VLVVLAALGHRFHVAAWAGSHGAWLGVVVGGVVVVVGVVVIATRSAGARTPRPEPGWADRAELATLLVREPPGDRLVLGRLGGVSRLGGGARGRGGGGARGRGGGGARGRGGRAVGSGLRRASLVAAEHRQSVLVVGPSQSGKTTGLAIPALLEWRGPVLATSVKTDLIRQTIDARRRLGPVDVYDPTGVTGLATSGWSPLTAASSWPGARRIAAALCSVARDDGGMDDAGFWYASAEKLLAPLLLAAASAGATMSDVVRWIDDQDLSEALLALELAGEPEAVRAARTSFAREDRQRSSVFATAETVVAAFADPDVARSTRLPPIDPAALVAGSSVGDPGRTAALGYPTLYCCAPARDQERLRPAFVALAKEVIGAAFEVSTRSGAPLDPGLLVVLDEAANVAPLNDLDTILATAAGHGISLVTVWQDLAQVEARYGRRWPTIVNNHRAKVLCPGVADPLTLDHLSALIGDGERTEESTTTGAEGQWSRTESSSLRRLAPPGSLRRLDTGEAVVIYGALAPGKVRLRPPAPESAPVPVGVSEPASVP